MYINILVIVISLMSAVDSFARLDYRNDGIIDQAGRAQQDQFDQQIEQIRILQAEEWFADTVEASFRRLLAVDRQRELLGRRSQNTQQDELIGISDSQIIGRRRTREQADLNDEEDVRERAERLLISYRNAGIDISPARQGQVMSRVSSFDLLQEYQDNQENN